jgi:hypothetical protein
MTASIDKNRENFQADPLNKGVENSAVPMQANASETHSPVQTVQCLPTVIDLPLSREEIEGMLKEHELAFLDKLAGSADVFYLAKSSTKYDTGGWFGKREIWVAALQAELILFATGSVPFSDRIPFATLDNSIYNHVTGALVLAPGHDMKITGLALEPLAGYQLLAQIYNLKGAQND